MPVVAVMRNGVGELKGGPSRWDPTLPAHLGYTILRATSGSGSGTAGTVTTPGRQAMVVAGWTAMAVNVPNVFYGAAVGVVVQHFCALPIVSGTPRMKQLMTLVFVLPGLIDPFSLVPTVLRGNASRDTPAPRQRISVPC